jgi:hypothetical protein
MATFLTPPIDLYAESTEDFGEEHPVEEAQHRAWNVRPADNGDRDEPAIDAGQRRLEQVLGW